jgi:hypothetical protein
MTEQTHDQYLFHQTPATLATALIQKVPLIEGDRVLEPFKGEGSFYDNLPEYVIKDWCEITQGRDYKDYEGEIDWVISNPPFNINKKNVFFPILEYYSTRAKKGIAFLGSDYCLATLTPLRMKKLNDNGFYLSGYTLCNVKKWRGRYFFMLFTRTPNPSINFLAGNF